MQAAAHFSLRRVAGSARPHAAPARQPTDKSPAGQARAGMFPEWDGVAAQLRLREGLLQMPRFRPGLPWLSAQVGATRFHDTAGPGWAEESLLGNAPGDALLDRAARACRSLLGARVGGACWADPPRAIRGAALAVVQAGHGEAATRAMLDQAAADGPATAILLVLPPGPARRGWGMGAGWRLTRRVLGWGGQVVVGPVDPWSLIERAAVIHAGGGDPIALLGLMAGVPVHCHRAGLAAGWGATTDAPHIRPRPVRREAAEILAATLFQGTRYRDPFAGGRIRCEDAIDLCAEWRRLGDANRRIGSVAGMQFWKRRRMAQFFHTGVAAPPFGTDAPAGSLVAAWSSRVPAGLARDGRLARVEDGFVRSVGLGSDFLPPCSIVVDAEGIYYDPRQPSGLETILNETRFEPPILDRAQRLVGRLVAGNISKYGQGGGRAPAIDAPPGRRRILVPGQVADDQSVRTGGAGIAGNLALLERVRAAAPDAYIVYKPHPDVDAGHRAGAVADATARSYADQIVRGAPMPALIDAVDEVHTLTSLSGFEALLRGKAVACYGQPFYAGWGLTTDLNPPPRRGRRLSLAELAAGTLLLYPRYLDPVTGLPCPAEILLDRLADPVLCRALGRGSLLNGARRLQGRMRRGWSRWRMRPAEERR